MRDWYPQYIYLILGLISFSGAVVSTCTGKARLRFSGWVYRAIEPRQFWWVVAMYYVGAVLFIGIFLFLHSLTPHLNDVNGQKNFPSVVLLEMDKPSAKIKQ